MSKNGWAKSGKGTKYKKKQRDNRFHEHKKSFDEKSALEEQREKELEEARFKYIPKSS